MYLYLQQWRESYQRTKAVEKLIHSSLSPKIILPFQIPAERATGRGFENKLILPHRWHDFPAVNMNLLNKLILKLIRDDVADIALNTI